MKILIDNGHGRATAGKRSPVWPDGKQLFEYEFNRDIARRVHEAARAGEGFTGQGDKARRYADFHSRAVAYLRSANPLFLRSGFLGPRKNPGSRPDSPISKRHNGFHL